ncbi:hypothetical protein CCMA1212_005963 [Trichoderma ghanense]|uniref:Uncharacterized protein n=1 Tax=Trichoderma ghanense TaxID=65468 RepID=A0ABY2H1J0_9HYPO
MNTALLGASCTASCIHLHLRADADRAQADAALAIEAWRRVSTGANLEVTPSVAVPQGDLSDTRLVRRAC